jgi:DNA-binding MarR family transcriptional regulator
MDTRKIIEEAWPRRFTTTRQEGVFTLLRTADVVRRRLERMFESFGLAGQQYNVLRILRGARPEALPTMEIAARMIERAPGITRLLDRLEEKGMVQRERHWEDRRQVLCSITNLGLQTLAQLDEIVDAEDEAVFEMLDDAEVRQVVALLERVREGSEQGGR